MSEKKIPILTSKQFAEKLIEFNKQGKRICFILGAGASKESGIPTGNELEMRWMDYLMGESLDGEADYMKVEKVREYSVKLFEEDEIEHEFVEIEEAWKRAKENNQSIPSAYYFDIYRLRFYDDQSKGYRYLEKIMENCEPSLGYRILALILTDKQTINISNTAKNEVILNNLVVTTNFDSLTEDALFLYTEKKPLIISHESLASYVKLDLNRPIIAKVHRDLLYQPFNTAKETKKLRPEWKATLNDIFEHYIPIVIGYAGGDDSLMSFVRENSTCENMFWCFRSHFPEKSILELIYNKNGTLVQIDGFDSLMMEIGNLIYSKSILPNYLETYLQKENEERIKKYSLEWNKLNKDPMIDQLFYFLIDEDGEEDRELKRIVASANYVEEGKKLYMQGFFRRSIDCCNKAIILDEKYPYAYYYRGNAYFELKDYQAALNDYKMAIELKPEIAEYHKGCAGVYFNLEKYKESLTEINKAIKLAPDQSMFYIGRGDIYSKLKRYKEAIEDYNKAIKLEPNNAQAYNNRGYVYNKLGKPEIAIADYDKAIELKFDYAKAYNNRASANISLKRFEKAVDDYSKELIWNSNSPNAYANRGYAYSMLGDNEKAIKDYNKAIELDPSYHVPYQNRGALYIKLSENDLAIEDLMKSVNLSSNEVTGYINLANAYLAQGDYENVIATCNKIIEINANYARAYSVRGKAYLFLGKYDKALSDHNKSIELEPYNADNYTNCGLVYYTKGNYDDAIEHYNRAIKLDPENPNPYINLGALFLVNKEYERAVKSYSKAIELNPYYSLPYSGRAAAYFELKEYKKARQDYSDASVLSPDNFNNFFGLGEVYFALKNYSQAIKEYTTAIKLKPDYEETYQRRADVYRTIGQDTLAEADERIRNILKKGEKYEMK